jgi:hypothetical protein
MAAIPQLPAEETPKLSYRTARRFELREASFSPEEDEAINKWVHSQVETKKKQLEILHTKKVPEWRRIAEGKPREEKKSWPFPNCSNLVHQLVGESCDDLAARVMGLLYATSPLVYFRYFTKAANEQEAHHNSEKSRVLEQFIDYAGYEPCELDLYPIENKWFMDSAKLAKAWVVVRPEEKIEAVYIGYDEAKKAKDFQDETLYEGPKVDNLRYEQVLYDPNCPRFEDSDLIARVITLSKRDLQERVFKGFYRKEDVEKILGKPDRYGPPEVKKRENQKKGITSTEERILAEWDVHECYFYWYHSKKKYRLICWYHWETKTMLNQVFNFIPDNQIPIIETQLSVDGMGMAEMGKDAQEEVSTAKNQRNDAITWGILGVNRISPQNRNIDKNFQLFPGATVPFREDEFEHYNVADAAMSGLSLQNEQAMIAQARERFGVGPAVAGMGAGSADKKGKFGSMGTLAVMQDSNTRVAHRLSGFRHSHVKLIGLVTDMYGAMGLGRKGSLFGLDDKLLEEALSDYLERKVRIPIRAATGSANKEVTKQNELLLNQAIMMYTKETSQMIQAIENQGIPPHYKKWMISIVKAKTRLMQQIIRDFQLSDQPEEYIPNVDFPEEQNVQAAQGGARPPADRLIQMAGAIPRPGSGGPAVPGASMVEAGGGLPGQGGGPAA